MVRPIRLRSADGAEAGRKVTWLELFFDLAFVAAVSQVGTPLAMDYSPGGLARYAVLFFLIWWAWLGHTTYATRFDTDDLVQRLLTLAQIFGVAVMAINADEALDSRSSAGFAVAYGGLRALLAFQYFRARNVPRAGTFAMSSAAGYAMAAAVWVTSGLTPAPARFALWALALGIDLGTSLVTGRHTAQVPPDAAHLPERFGLFTIILIGESLVSVIKGMKSQDTWTLSAASSALLGMAMAFTIWWWYFDGVEGAGERRVASHHETRLFHVWAFSHLPLYLGIAVAGVGVEHVIRFAPTMHLEAAEAWMLCGALAAAMAAVTAIAASRPHAGMGRGALIRHSVLAAATVALGGLRSHVAPAPLLLGLVALALAQLAISLNGRDTTPVHHASPNRVEAALD
jgi:low temperature requirement protein LtrA